MSPLLNPLEYPLLLRAPRWQPADSASDGSALVAMLVVAASQPADVVEIGVGRGETYAAVCQAIEELALPGRALGIAVACKAAVDARRRAAIGEFRAHHDALYGGFSRLADGSPTAWAGGFPPGTVDLLHLGAGLTPDEAGAAYDAWRPALSPRALVLVSGIGPAPDGASRAGVWTALRNGHPHFELTLGSGMGLVATGPGTPAPIASLFAASAAERRALGELLFRLGQAATLPRASPAELSGLQRDLAAGEAERAKLQQTLGEHSELADALRARIEVVTAREREMRALYLDLHRQLLDRDSATMGVKDRRQAERDEHVTQLRVELAQAQTLIRTIQAGRIYRVASMYWRARERMGLGRRGTSA